MEGFGILEDQGETGRKEYPRSLGHVLNRKVTDKMNYIVFVFLILYAASSNSQEIKTNILAIEGPELKRAEAYWTKNRIKNARPFPLINADEETLIQFQEPIESWKENGIEINSARADVNERPFSYNGKFFGTTNDGVDFQCSASFVKEAESENQNIIMTAAHCVRDHRSGHWFGNFLFKRAYNDGGGQDFGINCVGAWDLYAPAGHAQYDYAFMRTTTDSGVGSLTLIKDIPYDTFTATGYPSNYESGRYLYQVSGRKFLPTSRTSKVVYMALNPFRGESSGGPWIADLRIGSTEGNYAVGLNAHPFIRIIPGVKGPYFNDAVLGLYQKVRVCHE